MLKKLTLIAVLLPVMAFARARTSGYCEQGGQVSVTAFVSSTTKIQQSYPQCIVHVYLSGTLTPATLYTDNAGTALGNPFTASKTGYWFWYANNGTYDISVSGGGIPVPFTWGAISVFDPFSFASVEDYGAFGDGSHSDCPGFVAAIASGSSTIFATQSSHYYLPCTLTFVSGQSIQWGSGVHLANGFIIPDSSTLKTVGNVSLFGQGNAVTMLKQLAGANQDFIRSNSFYSLFGTANQYGTHGLVLSNLTIDGNKANQTIVTATITGITATTPMAVTTAAPHGFTTGDMVCQKHVIGMPEANNCFQVTVTGATT